MADKDIENLLIVECQKDTFNEMKEAGTLEPDALYCVKGEDYTAEEIDNLLLTKQDTLVSGTNIKTINGESVLGSGDLEIQGGGYYPNIFDLKWSDHIINDIQWLRADTFSWQSGDVYVTAYNTLVIEYSTGVEEIEDGITFRRTTNDYKIADASQEQAILNKYNTDGIAWYYILDTANKQFKLPRMKYKYWKNQSTLPVVGNGKTLGLTNGTETFGMSNETNIALCGRIGLYNKSIGSAPSGNYTAANKSVGLTADGTKSGIEADISNVINELPMYLYFYVGEYAREAIEQTAGLNTELFNNKADKSAVDGQWVGKSITLANNVALPTSVVSFDLSNYLPNDNYNYELIVRGQVTTPATSGSSSALYIFSSIIPSNILVARMNTRTASTMEAGSSTTIPVGTDKTLSVYGDSGYVGTYRLYVYGYRRIGTNQ